MSSKWSADIFKACVSPGEDCIDVDAFIQICQDANFFNGNFSEADAERIFAQIVPKQRGRMNVDEFDAALNRIAGIRLGSLNAFAARYGDMTEKSEFPATAARMRMRSSSGFRSGFKCSLPNISPPSSADRSFSSRSSSLPSLLSPSVVQPLQRQRSPAAMNCAAKPTPFSGVAKTVLGSSQSRGAWASAARPRHSVAGLQKPYLEYKIH